MPPARLWGRHKWRPPRPRKETATTFVARCWGRACCAPIRGRKRQRLPRRQVVAARPPSPSAVPCTVEGNGNDPHQKAEGNGNDSHPPKEASPPMDSRPSRPTPPRRRCAVLLQNGGVSRVW